jgi:Methyltransferase domain
VFVLRSSIRRLVPAPLKYLILRMLSEPTAIPLQYDSFLRSLQFVNPGMLHQGNIALFDHCISRLQSTAPLIEIGSFCGLSLNAIIYLLDKHCKPNEVFSVDAWHFEGAPNGTIGASNLPFSKYRDHAIETFRSNVTLFSGHRLPRHIAKDSDEFFADWRRSGVLTDFFGHPAQLGGPIAMAYIDGDHSYAQSMRDFRNVDAFLEPGGFIVFDDSSDGSGWESNRTAREAAADPRYQLVARNPNYCIQKVRGR